MNKLQKVLPLLVLIGVLCYLIGAYWEISSNILWALIGFGAIVFIHELGHFIVARVSDIEIESFAIGFAIGTPFLLGIKRIENGFRIRVLPKTSGAKENLEEDCLVMFTIPANCKAGETEYCIGPMPLGGFVKMLGQDDTGPVEQTDNPRSFANKSVGIRMAVISAGVIFNIIGAFFIFTWLSASGFERMPAVVGQVFPDSPAEKAGLEFGDEFVEIDGKTLTVDGKPNIDFSHILRAAILSKKGEQIPMKVKGTDGSVRDITMAAEMMPGESHPKFGITPLETLEIGGVATLSADSGNSSLEPGDEVIAVDGVAVENAGQYYDEIEKLKKDVVKDFTVEIKRMNEEGGITVNDFVVPATYSPTLGGEIKDDTCLANVFTMVPRLRVLNAVADVTDKAKSDDSKKAASDSEDIENEKTQSDQKMQAGDIIVKLGDVENPTFVEMRAVTQKFANKPMPVTVLRKSEIGGFDRLSFEVTPKKAEGEENAKIGIYAELDMDHPVVSKVIGGENGDVVMGLPRGAVITSVDGEPVKSFFDVAHKLASFKGQRVPVEYNLGTAQTAGAAIVNVPLDSKVSLSPELATVMSFKPKLRLYKVDLLSAPKMGVYLIGDTIEQSYSTLKMLFTKNSSVKAKDLTGPVGIAKLSYDIVKNGRKSYFLFFLGMISCFLAVMNFLPIPVVDGGHFVLLIVEKIKGAPVGLMAQQVLTYIGLALLGTLFIYVTYQDILKLFGV